MNCPDMYISQAANVSGSLVYTLQKDILLELGVQFDKIALYIIK